ncbi:MAG: hypothetical protein WCX30_01760 [Candidatus Paceibacterota bacterium]|jgi:hypothetical protein|nr:hypothetical protein [bacterium]
MTIITISGLPKEYDYKIDILATLIIEDIKEVSKLKDENNIKIIFLPDLSSEIKNEVIIEITNLYIECEKIQEIRQILAMQIGKAISIIFPDSNIECFVSTNQYDWSPES